MAKPATAPPALFPMPVGFSVEYFDPVANSLRTFVLTVFPDQRVQMVCSNNKTFLSKTYAKDLQTTDLYIGGTVSLFSRELSIVDYADKSTRKYFEVTQSKGFVMVLPSAMGSLGEVCGDDERKAGSIGRAPSVITNAKMFRPNGKFCRPEEPPAALEDALPESGPVLALEIVAESRHGGFEGLLGVVNGLRQRYGGGVFASSTPAEASEHARYIFRQEPTGQNQQPNGGKNNSKNNEQECTLCVVKPHIVRGGRLGAVLSFVVQRGFEVADLQMLYLGEVGTEELLRPYRGVVPYHADAVRHLKSGPCGGHDVVEEFREACGPSDPEVAKALYPDSLRALLGVQQATNAVHCTDMTEDGLLECNYMFGVVAKDRYGA
ncbi:unnamed protein product [Pylaiella littoralis]